MMTPLAGPHPNPHPPRLFTPPQGACDSHCHVFGPHDRFPMASDRAYEPAEATIEDYGRLQHRLGLSRAVLVQPAVYGPDHTAMLSAIATAPQRLRGVGLVGGGTGEEVLRALDQGGIRGARFNFLGRLGGASMAEVHATAEQVKVIGWHVALHVDAAALLEHGDAIAALPCPVLIDHMARLPACEDVSQPAFRLLLELAALPHVWVKLSAGDRMVTGPDRLADAVPFIAALAEASPDRSLWGTDWPHPNASFTPDDGDMIDLFATAVSDAGRRQAILVANPARLYGFGEA